MGNAPDLQKTRGAAILTKAFHTPKAVPSKASSPTRMGIEAINVMAFELRAKELIRIGTSGCTLVKPMRANTTT
jgi:hypothetical protein